MAEILPFTSYFPQQSLLEAKQQGEQLKQMKRQGEQQDEQYKFNKFTQTMDFLDNAYDNYGPEAVSELLKRPELRNNIGPYVDPDSIVHKRDRKGTKTTRILPNIDLDGIGRDGKPITIKAKTPAIRTLTPDGKEYLTPDIMTVEDAKKVAELEPNSKDAATALQKNTAFIAKTLKMPKEKALQMAMESKVQSRESFIMSMLGRLVSTSMGRADRAKMDEMKKNAGDLWDSLNKAKFGATGEAPATSSEQDWLGATLEEE